MTKTIKRLLTKIVDNLFIGSMVTLAGSCCALMGYGRFGEARDMKNAPVLEGKVVYENFTKGMQIRGLFGANIPDKYTMKVELPDHTTRVLNFEGPNCMELDETYNVDSKVKFKDPRTFWNNSQVLVP